MPCSVRAIGQRHAQAVGPVRPTEQACAGLWPCECEDTGGAVGPAPAQLAGFRGAQVHRAAVVEAVEADMAVDRGGYLRGGAGDAAGEAHRGNRGEGGEEEGRAHRNSPWKHVPGSALRPELGNWGRTTQIHKVELRATFRFGQARLDHRTL